MLLKYFYNSKLAHASYMVGCQRAGEAIIIDPGRDLEPYLAEAKSQGLRLVAVTETHIHADFLSGARELAEQAGAKLYLSAEGGQNWAYQYLDSYNHQLLRDGDAFKIGNIKFEVLHTPGHTPEHISLLVTDTAGADKPMGIFTGDFVFVGDVGRPDLLEKAAGETGTAETGARQMFRSLQRFKTLPDYMQVWPAHGAGSACGKALGAIPSTTVGYEKMFNAALGYTDIGPFTKALLDGQPEPPKYFAMMKRLNKQGPKVLGQLSIPSQLSLEQLKTLLAHGATLVDTRPASAFSRGHLPGTINIPYDGAFINWAGWLLDYNTPFYLIAYSGQITEMMHDLSYIGLDNAAGYFEPNVIEAWSRSGGKLQSYPVITAQEIGHKVKQNEVTVIDVRGLNEWQEGHIPEAQHIMLGYLSERLAEIPTGKPVVVQCQAGARSAIGASILQAKGFPNVMNLEGGISAWAAAGLPVGRGRE
jgi:hydroxyacylglutathione hydrolase